MHPLLLRIGNFNIFGLHVGEFGIGTYGLMLALGLVAGIAAALVYARREGVPSQLVIDLVFFAVLGGIAGGRIAYIFGNWAAFEAHPWQVLFSRSGFVFLGSVAGALVLIGWIVWRKRLNFWRLADVLVTGVPLGHAFGRVGCFLAGCCHGRPIAEGSFWSWLGVHYPPGVVVGNEILGGAAFDAYPGPVNPALDPPAAEHSLGVWPTQLFESAANVLIFLALLWAWRRRRFSGQIFLAYLTLYPVVRFLLECLRGDDGRGTVGPFSTSQAGSLLALAAAAALWRHLARRGLGGPAVPPEVVAAYSLGAPAAAQEPAAEAAVPRPTRNGRGKRKR